LFDTLVRLLDKDERGQDLSEYCLLTAVVALLALGLYLYVSGGVKNLWTNANSTLGSSAQVGTVSGGASGTEAH